MLCSSLGDTLEQIFVLEQLAIESLSRRYSLQVCFGFIESQGRKYIGCQIFSALERGFRPSLHTALELNDGLCEITDSI